MYGHEIIYEKQLFFKRCSLPHALIMDIDVYHLTSIELKEEMENCPINELVLIHY